MKTIPAISERDLLLQLRDGTYSAFTELYNRYYENLIFKLSKLFPIPEIAEEFHQDIFMAIWEERESLPIEIPFATILYRKARSLAYNYYKKATLADNYRTQLIVSATEHCDNLQEYLNYRETNEILLYTIDKLPEQRRKIFTRIKIDGKSYEEVAEEFGVSLSTVKDHMTRALKFVRSELSDKHSTALFLLFASSIFSH